MCIFVSVYMRGAVVVGVVAVAVLVQSWAGDALTDSR